jgi:2-octaprenylphenol hydroxylase
MSGADFDVAVVGGGMVGAACAALLARNHPARAGRVLLLERDLPEGAAALQQAAQPEAAARPQHAARPGVDLRVSAFSHASARILAAAGHDLSGPAAHASPYERMHVWGGDSEPRGAGSLTFDAAAIGSANLGWIVPNRGVQVGLLRALHEAGAEVRAAELQSLRFGADAVELGTSMGAVTARLVVGADGARSVLRRLAGLGVDTQDYGQLALVANLATGRAHESCAWQHFLGHGTLALLPLASGECSLVWSLPRAQANRLLAASAADFAAEVTRDSQGVLGDLELRSARVALPLQRSNAPRYVLERCALIGDAAHVVHPLAGQGVNLGLLDAAALAEVLAPALAGRPGAAAEDPGALRLLRRYERWRRSDNELMSAAIDGFNRFLAFGTGAPGRILQRGLGLLDRSALAKQFFIGRALGTQGDVPRIARAG